MSETLIINHELIERNLGDEIVIMTPDGQEIHSLDNTALFIWKKIKAGENLEKILSFVIEEYKVSERIAKEDLKAFITDLEKKEILKKRNPQ